MRTVIILLLLANLTFLAYTRLDRAPAGEAARLTEQVDPQKIRLLTAREAAALGAGKVAADLCLEWGPLGDTDRAKALSDLEPLALGRLLSQKRSDGATLVIRDPTPSVIARLRELVSSYPGTAARVGGCDKG